MFKTIPEKFKTIIDKNTFYFFNHEFEEKYEGRLTSLRETLLILKNEIDTNGLRKSVFEKLLANNDNGLVTILALTGFSNESLKRLITLIRVVDNETLSRLSLKEHWNEVEKLESIKEWSNAKIARKIKTNKFFREGIVNIFFEGATIPFLADTIPLFELKKLSITKLSFDLPAMIDTLVRYKEKGSYSGKKGNNPETVIENLLGV